ncbi:MAG: maleylpyruvate isomerase N-terminal domain-containing protein [Thermomicrobiales bacterium]
MSEDRTEARIVLDEIETSWRDFWTTINALSDEDLTGPTDAAGWRGQDHIAHLGAWERGVIFMLNGYPFHAGLGVDEELWVNGDIDTLNAVIYDLNRDRELEDVRTGVRATHTELLTTIGGLEPDQFNAPIPAGDAADPANPPLLREKIAGRVDRRAGGGCAGLSRYGMRFAQIDSGKRGSRSTSQTACAARELLPALK